MPERPRRHSSRSVTPVSSPCIRNCCLDDDDVCLGCFRSVDEIIAWENADDGQRRRILDNAEQRKRQRPDPEVNSARH